MSPIRGGRHAMDYREQHYMDELQRSLEKACPDRVIDFQFGSIHVPTWDFEKNEEAIWIVEEVEHPPYEDEAHIELVHENGYEIAYVTIHLPSSTITSAEISEYVKSLDTKW